MSYDAYLKIDTGGDEPATVCDIGNYTSNVSGMWRKALGKPLGEYDGVLAGDMIPDLERAVNDMIQNPQVYLPMNPDNGWGNYGGAKQYLEDILAACREHPKAFFHLSR